MWSRFGVYPWAHDVTLQVGVVKVYFLQSTYHICYVLLIIVWYLRLPCHFLCVNNIFVVTDSLADNLLYCSLFAM